MSATEQELARRMTALIAGHEAFSANELTDCGRFAFDDEHSPNGKQSGLGPLFNTAARLGHIEQCGTTESCSPARKSGLIRLWRSTERGREWAQRQLDAEPHRPDPEPDVEIPEIHATAEPVDDDPICVCGYRRSLHTPDHPHSDAYPGRHPVGPTFQRAAFLNLDAGAPELRKYLDSKPMSVERRHH